MLYNKQIQQLSEGKVYFDPIQDVGSSLKVIQEAFPENRDNALVKLAYYVKEGYLLTRNEDKGYENAWTIVSRDHISTDSDARGKTEVSLDSFFL